MPSRHHFLFWAALCATSLLGASADPLFESAQKKMDSIESGHVKRGSIVFFSPAEINAWVRGKTPQVVAGVREPRIELGLGTVKGYALVDLAQIRQSAEPSPFLTLLAGERPVEVLVRVESAVGKCTTFLDEVQFSGTKLNGGLLNFLIKAFFQPMFPDAKIDRPFTLREPMERLEMRPDGVRVWMKK
jgi:hypothetical protein